MSAHAHHHDAPMSYEEQLAAHRAMKDEAFRHEQWSPIPHEERHHAFEGLRYYPPDEQYRFLAKLIPNPDPQTIRMEASTGQPKMYRNVGHFELAIGDKLVKLQAYRADGSDALFIPFRDRTSGKETYGAGRYLDLEWEGADADYVVDFNLAYNPFCAYDDAYSCPFPPPENWLQVEIPAGEKTYKSS